MATKENGRLSTDQRLRLWMLLIERCYHFLRFAIAAFSVIAVFGFIYLSIDALSGAETSTDINLKLDAETNVFVHILGKLGTERIIFLLLTVFALFYGWVQKRLRYKKTAHLQGRIKALELQIDPKRTSSGLTETGETPKEDLP